MVELDFRDREREGRRHLAERLQRLRATLAATDARRRRAPRPEPVRDADGDKPTWWWQRD
ncbi:MAG TPA: hypothetical protein VMT17_13050 [Anaeromyxobacteraceae bacterium]|nr:hypothetical protein [Anaeromyxobacteraceae bacterium]